MIFSAASAAELKGRATGALFMAGFGALWMIIGLKYLQRLGWRSGLLVLVMTAALVFGGIKQSQRANSLPREATSPTSAVAAKAMNHRFNVIFATELIAIAAAVILFNLLHRQTLILPTVAVIVGLHFLPLASLFGAPMFYSTGAAMILTVLVAYSMRGALNRQAVIGLGCGLVLWITAVLLLLG